MLMREHGNNFSGKLRSKSFGHFVDSYLENVYINRDVFSENSSLDSGRLFLLKFVHEII